MPASEFLGWIEFNEIDPIGQQRADIRSAIIAQTIANVYSKKTYPITTFMPFHKPPKEKDQRKMVRESREAFQRLADLAKQRKGKRVKDGNG